MATRVGGHAGSFRRGVKLLYLHHVPITRRSANVLQVLHMCRAFAELGHDVTLAIPGAGVDDDTALKRSVERDTGLALNFELRTFRSIGIRGRPAMLGAWLGARRLLRSLADVDLCYVRNPLFLVLAQRAGRQTIFESHDDRLHPRPVLHRIYIRWVQRAATRPTLLKLVAISEALAERWRRTGFPGEKVQVEHDAVDPDMFGRQQSRDDARRELGLPQGVPLVVYTGSLAPDRGIGAILSLASTVQHARFLVVGGTEQEVAALRAEVTSLGLRNVDVRGSVPHVHVPSYLQAADVLLALWGSRVPTIHICSPLKVFEYMAAGRTIVGYGFPTIREVLGDGETALLATPEDIPELQTKLERALALGYPNDIASNARSRALAQHTWRGRAERVLAGVGGLAC
jgi:glycosyltransferase involved in cell wall biosynthesis